MATHLTPAAPLRITGTRALPERALALIPPATALGVLILGLWQVVGVENGAFGTVLGLVLVCLTPSLVRGRRRAHLLACLLTAGALVPTARGGSSDELALTAVALGLLAALAPSFRALGDPATRRAARAACAVAILALAADVGHATGVLLHPVLAVTLVIALVLGLRSLRPWRQPPASAAERRRAAALVARYGTDTLAPFALRADKRYRFSPDGRAFLAYRVVAGVAVVSGDPVGEPDACRDLLAAFVADARRRGWVPAALGLSLEQVRAWRALGFNAHYTGDEAVVDPRRFSLDGRRMRKVRQSVARLERAGYCAEVRWSHELNAQLAATLAAIADEWRAGRSETGFSMAFASAAVEPGRDDLYVLARREDGEIGGFLHLGAVPAGRALSLSSMRRRRDTPNGLNEFLVCALLDWARAQEIARVSLNFAAFAKVLEPPDPLDAVTRLEGHALRRLSGRFQLERLLRFNAKFEPDWEPRYAAYPSLASLPRIGLAAMLAEAYVQRPPWWPL